MLHFPVYTDTGKRGRQMGVPVRDYTKTKKYFNGNACKRVCKESSEKPELFFIIFW